MSLTYSASVHVSTRTHKWAWRLSRDFAHSRRPRARPSCCRAFLITCCMMRQVGRQPHAGGRRGKRCAMSDGRSPDLQGIFDTHFSFRRLSNDLLLSSTVDLNVISSVRHPAVDGLTLANPSSSQTTETHFWTQICLILQVIDVVFRSLRCKERESLLYPWEPNKPSTDADVTPTALAGSYLSIYLRTYTANHFMRLED